MQTPTNLGKGRVSCTKKRGNRSFLEKPSRLCNQQEGLLSGGLLSEGLLSGKATVLSGWYLTHVSL